MKNKPLIIGFVVLAVIAVFFYLRGNAQESTVQTPATITVNLDSYSDSGQTGMAILTEGENGITVILNLSGYDPDVPQPSHIHTGQCPRIGPVVHALTDVVEGKSMTNLDTTLEELKQEGELNINVHASYDDFKTYTACGNINY